MRKRDLALMMLSSSCLVTIKRNDDKTLEELAKGPEQACWKASGNHDNATAVV